MSKQGSVSEESGPIFTRGEEIFNRILILISISSRGGIFKSENKISRINKIPYTRSINERRSTRNVSKQGSVSEESGAISRRRRWFCTRGEERGTANAREREREREETKPKINALHLLGQFAPSVGPACLLLPSPRLDLFRPPLPQTTPEPGSRIHPP